RLRNLLPRLPEAAGGAVAVISGRRIEELDRILAPHVYVAAGVHGLQRRFGDRGIEILDSGQVLGEARNRLESFAAAHAGVWLEDKEVALALHYRSRPELEPEVHRFAGALQLELPPDVEILLGNKVCEIKSGVMDKGGAIDAFHLEPTFT